MARGRLSAVLLQRVLGGRKRGPRRVGGLEGIAVLELARLLATLRSDWDRELLLQAGGADQVVPSVPNLPISAGLANALVQVLVDAQRRAGVLGWWFGQANLAGLERMAITKPRESLPDFPRDPEVAVKAIVSGEIENLVPSRAIAWFEGFDFDANRKWPEALRDRVASIVSTGAAEGETVTQVMAKLDGLLGGVTPRSVRVNKAAWLENVVRTNSMTMASAGQYLAYQDNPYVAAFEWFAISDDRICPICLPMDGVILQEGARLWPPLHYMCRCVVAPVVEGEPEADDAVTRASALGGIRDHMQSLEDAGETADLGAATANTASRQFEEMLRQGFGGRSFIDGLHKAGLA